MGVAANGRYWSLDEEFAHIAREEIPGFGGYFIDSNGELNVYLKEPARSGEALDMLKRVWSARGLGRGLHVDFARAQVRPAKYDFVQLKSWRETARAVLGLSGVVTLDVDEARNKVVIGVSSARGRMDVTRAVRWLDIPADAVVVQDENPIRVFQTEIVDDQGGGGGGSSSTLKSYFRPLIGGFEITFPRNGLNFGCALGVNARDGSGRNGFLTASHCTETQGGLEYTSYFQGGDFIGTEANDPKYTTAPSFNGHECPPKFTCRHSDAAFALHQTPSYSFGYIAKTESQYGGKTYQGVFKIVYEYRLPVALITLGMRMDKVGPETGWTFGAVTRTCIDAESGDKIFYCQDFVGTTTDPGSAEGDSGSPVFTIGSNDEVRYYGVLWGGSSTTDFVFSNLQNIWADGIDVTTFIS